MLAYVSFSEFVFVELVNECLITMKLLPVEMQHLDQAISTQLQLFVKKVALLD